MKLEFHNGRMITRVGVSTSQSSELDLLRTAMDLGLECTATFRMATFESIGSIDRVLQFRRNLTELAKLYNDAAIGLDRVGRDLLSDAIAGRHTEPQLSVKFRILHPGFVNSFEWHCLRYDLQSLEVLASIPATAT